MSVAGKAVKVKEGKKAPVARTVLMVRTGLTERSGIQVLARLS